VSNGTLKMTFVSDWEWRTQTGPPPAGKISSNTGNWTGVTTLIVSAKDYDGEDTSADISALLPGDTVKIEHLTDPAIFSNWTVSAAPVKAAGGYFTLSVSPGAVQGVPQANTLMQVTLTYTQLPGPSPESALYWVLTGSDLVQLQHSADKLILAGFEPLGSLNASGTTPTYHQAFWRQNATARFVTERPQ
jgi:hypothetical protein